MNNPTDCPGLSTGLRPLDRLLGGLQTGLYILAARPSVGKTALALQREIRAASNVASSGGRVMIFTLEMSPEQLVRRLACSWAEVSLRGLLRGKLDSESYARFVRTVGCFCQSKIAGASAGRRCISHCRLPGVAIAGPAHIEGSGDAQLGTRRHCTRAAAAAAGGQRPGHADSIHSPAQSRRRRPPGQTADAVRPGANVMEVWSRKNRLDGPSGERCELFWRGAMMRCYEMESRAAGDGPIDARWINQ